jgi:hypothetical protein
MTSRANPRLPSGVDRATVTWAEGRHDDSPCSLRVFNLAGALALLGALTWPPAVRGFPAGLGNPTAVDLDLELEPQRPTPPTVDSALFDYSRAFTRGWNAGSQHRGVVIPATVMLTLYDGVFSRYARSAFSCRRVGHT